MPITDHKNYPFSFSMIDIKKIDPSPYQHRKYFDENSLRELGSSIVQDGLIEPIILLGIPLVRIAQRLKIHREIISKYGAPQPLVWSVILQEKTDQERFKDLNWGLRTWDNWHFNDVDHIGAPA